MGLFEDFMIAFTGANVNSCSDEQYYRNERLFDSIDEKNRIEKDIFDDDDGFNDRFCPICYDRDPDNFNNYGNGHDDFCCNDYDNNSYDDSYQDDYYNRYDDDYR